MTYVREVLMKTGDLQEKKEILLSLGSNLTVLNGKLSVSVYPWFQIVANQYPVVEKDYRRFEPHKLPMNKA